MGGNQGDVIGGFCRAVDLLLSVSSIQLFALSSLYKTQPVGPQNQPDYINGIISVKTILTPQSLLDRLLEIEAQLGRNRDLEQRWGERCIDLDLIAFDDVVLDTPTLILPHPRMAQRRFVLQPMADIAPNWCHPLLDQTVDMLLNAVNDPSRVERCSALAFTSLGKA
ncbi:MAG: 2-amino-4-hydroxy-6-hydroxymethyldihydropteridine diphosphokinase [Magnetococcales bacterium]|nr:2-amino-4-hydroxy-6-hydroxymethyldihydropteridine diphosphokinase [Magnetococcales bacterium]